MLILVAILSLFFSFLMVVTAVYERMPAWVVIGLFGNAAHSISFLFRVMS